MIKKFLRKVLVGEEEAGKRPGTAVDNNIVQQIYEVLKTSENSKGFCVFISNLYVEESEERLNHHFFTVRFKDNDLPLSLKEYERLVDNHLQQRARERMETKVKQVISAPIEPATQTKQPIVGEKNTFRVEDTNQPQNPA